MNSSVIWTSSSPPWGKVILRTSATLSCGSWGWSIIPGLYALQPTFYTFGPTFDTLLDVFRARFVVLTTTCHQQAEAVSVRLLFVVGPHPPRFLGTIGAGGVTSSSSPPPPLGAPGGLGAAFEVSPGPLMMLGFFWMVLGSLPFSMSTSAGLVSGDTAIWPVTSPVTI